MAKKKQAPPGSEVWSQDIRSRAKELVRAINEGYIELAEIIHTVWSTPIDNDPNNACICVSWGYSDYKEWAFEELGLHPSKVVSLKAIWHHFTVTLGTEMTDAMRRRILGIGWSKCRALIRVTDTHNFEEWVKVAEELTLEELHVAVRRAIQEAQEREAECGEQSAGEGAPKGAPDSHFGPEEREFKGVAPPTKHVRFRKVPLRFSPEQHAHFYLALRRAKELASSIAKPTNEQLIDLICTDFLATNTFLRKGDSKTPLKFLAKFEKLMGFRLVVVDPKTWTVRYGLATLQQMAEVVDDGEAPAEVPVEDAE